MKFPIIILLTCWPKPQTKVENFSLKRPKLLFSLFEITLFLIYLVRITFLGKRQEEKIIPHKIFYKDTIRSLA